MAIYCLRGYREYFGNMLRNISRMQANIPDDLTPYFLAPFPIIIHCISFKKHHFLKDNCFFLKDEIYFLKGGMPLFRLKQALK